MNNFTVEDFLREGNVFSYVNTDFVPLTNLIEYLLGIKEQVDYSWPEQYEFDIDLYHEIQQQIADKRPNDKDSKAMLKLLIDVFNKYAEDTRAPRRGKNEYTAFMIFGHLPQSIKQKVGDLTNYYYALDSKEALKILQNKFIKTELKDKDTKKFVEQFEKFLADKKIEKVYKKQNADELVTVFEKE